MLPYRDADTENWPVKNSISRKHYPAVLGITGFAAHATTSDEFFPLHSEIPARWQSSRSKLF